MACNFLYQSFLKGGNIAPISFIMCVFHPPLFKLHVGDNDVRAGILICHKCHNIRWCLLVSHLNLLTVQTGTIWECKNMGLITHEISPALHVGGTDFILYPNALYGSIENATGFDGY